MLSTQTVVATETIDNNLLLQLDEHQHKCIQCDVCVVECHFLTRYGDPQQLASAYDVADPATLARPFECNLCALCTQVCPEGLDPALMFLEMRREAFSRGLSDLQEHRGLRKYERTGNSKAYTWYALPNNCDTIFFPGCALVGSRSGTTGKVFEHLQQIFPKIGIFLEFCNKPSFDLGDNDHFKYMFTEMHTYLIEHNIKNVLVACPNCLKVFNQYAPDMVTRTIYEILAEHPLSDVAKVATAVTVHDPCASRADAKTQSAAQPAAHCCYFPDVIDLLENPQTSPPSAKGSMMSIIGEQSQFHCHPNHHLRRKPMNKYLLIITALMLSLVMTATAPAKDYNQISPQELKTRLDAGDVENGKLMIFSTQNPKEFSSGYLPVAIQTFARPLESEEDYRRLDIIFDRAKETTEDIVVICPRGGSGATRSYDYLEKNGIDSKRLFVLTKGQGAYNKAYPQDVVKISR